MAMTIAYGYSAQLLLSLFVYVCLCHFLENNLKSEGHRVSFVIKQ